MMAKMKLETPAWIREGYDSLADYEKARGIKTEKKKGKTFKIRKCPGCGSFDMVVVTGEEARGLWRCGKCAWKGKDVRWEELSEDEFMKYMDEKGEEVA